MLCASSQIQNNLHLSDESKGDSITLDNFVISSHTERSFLQVISHEEPTPTNFQIWKDAIQHLCSGTTALPTILGRYLCPPHPPCIWYLSADATRLFQIGNDPTCLSFCTYNVWQGRGTHHRSKYDWMSNKIEPHPGMHCASVLMFNAVCAIMHSKTPICLPTTPPPTFWEKLDSFGNGSLWVILLYNIDWEWIWDVLHGRSLCIAHNGSYMVEKLPSLCSAGVIFLLVLKTMIKVVYLRTL
jgi:hypothetical protein